MVKKPDYEIFINDNDPIDLETTKEWLASMDKDIASAWDACYIPAYLMGLGSEALRHICELEKKIKNLKKVTNNPSK